MLENVRWLQAQGVPLRGLRIRDGSGLSRGNRVTSRTLATLLWRMAQHPLGTYYQASMAIAGRRGTLDAIGEGTPCTVASGARQAPCVGFVSGFLETDHGPRYVSMIANGALAPRDRSWAGFCRRFSASAGAPHGAQIGAARRPRLIGLFWPALSLLVGSRAD